MIRNYILYMVPILNLFYKVIYLHHPKKLLYLLSKIDYYIQNVLFIFILLIDIILLNFIVLFIHILFIFLNL